MPKRLTWLIPVIIWVVFLGFGFDPGPPPKHRSPAVKLLRDLVPSGIVLINLLSLSTAVCLVLFDRIPKFNSRRRGFLRGSAVAACAIPAAVIGAGIITRKEFLINEIDISFPHLPDDLNDLRLLQISDIHMGTFFTRYDLRRVVDAANGLRGDLVFVTGDLISDQFDPLDQCLIELQRLRTGTGIWGCMGNHELYSLCQTYTKREAAKRGMDFLRYENRQLRFGNSKINLLGIDYHPRSKGLAPIFDQLKDSEAFNLLLSHTPATFPLAAKRGIELTLSGHTHGGQINMEIAGKNINLVDLTTPFTKGLYRQDGSAVYVNSGLGTIGVPVRIGAPPEVSVIRLCKS